MTTAILIAISFAFITFLAVEAWKYMRPPTKSYKPILCLDFDGVINSYVSGWQGPRALPDPPVEEAMAFLRKAVLEFEVHIYSSRSNFFLGRYYMKKWLWENLAKEFNEPLNPKDCWYDAPHSSPTRDTFNAIKWPRRKPPALLTIDDRGYCFNGTFPDLKEIKEFKPWYKR